MNKTQKKSKLTSLEWFIYNLLEERTYGNNKSLSQREIYDECRRANFDVKWSETQNQHNDHCRWLNKAIDHINKSLEVDKIVHHHAYRYYVCTFEQAEMLIEFYEKKIVFAAARKKYIKRKLKRHNQGKLLSNQGNPIDEHSKAKPFHETYCNEQEGAQK